MHVFIFEKPYAYSVFLDLIKAKVGAEPFVLINASGIVLGKPDYPHQARYASFPVILPYTIKAQKHRFGDDYFCRGLFVDKEGTRSQRALAFDEVRQIMRDASSLNAGVERCHSSAAGLSDFLQLTLGKREHEMSIFLYETHDPETIEAAFNQQVGQDDEAMRDLTKAGLIKRHFEHNFNYNSQVILGNLYRAVSQASRPARPAMITRNMVLTLDILRSASMPYNRLLGLLCGHNKWNGTGKYAGRTFSHLPTPATSASGSTVIKNLQQLGLVGEIENDAISLTDLGLQFVGKLHKDSGDWDLCFRLDGWMSLPMDEAKTKIDNYILSYFRKQKRFQGC